MVTRLERESRDELLESPNSIAKLQQRHITFAFESFYQKVFYTVTIKIKLDFEHLQQLITSTVKKGDTKL